MVAFNRIGATNASHHVGMIQKILRGEWAYKGVISTDMMNNSYYFNPEAMVMAGITRWPTSPVTTVTSTWATAAWTPCGPTSAWTA